MLSWRLAVLVLFVATATCQARESLSRVARFPDLVAQAKADGIDYPLAVSRADHSDVGALRSLFRFTRHMDGAAADSHCTVLRLLMEQLGDRRFSSALREEPRDLRSRVTRAIDFDFGHSWQKSFPLTYSLGSHDEKLLRDDHHI